MKYELPDVFLHFLNKDTQEIFNLHDNNEEAFSLIQKALNMAVLLCKEHCILPVGFYFESENTKRIILNNLDYIREGLVVFAMREDEILEFLEKKREQYEPFKNEMSYRRFFDKNEISELSRIQNSTIPRRTKVGELCLHQWENNLTMFIENNEGIISELYSIDSVGGMYVIPIAKTLKRKGLEIEGGAFIWKLMMEELQQIPERDPTFERQMRRLFEREYYRVYLDEFNASIIFDIFLFDRTDDFLLKKSNLSASNYQWFNEFLACFQLDYILGYCSANQIAMIKRLPSFEYLVQSYLNICNSNEFSKTTASIRKEVSRLVRSTNSDLQEVAEDAVVEIDDIVHNRKENKIVVKTTNNFNGKNQSFPGTNFGSVQGGMNVNARFGNVQGNITVRFANSDIAGINSVIEEIVKSATEQDINEKDEVVAKMEELRQEIVRSKPNEKKIRSILDYSHKITAISTASYSIYKIIAPIFGWPSEL